MMLHIKFQGHGSIGSGEEDFLRFLPYMGMAGLSQPFLGMGPGPLELGKIASFRLKLGKKYNVLCIKFLLSN